MATKKEATAKAKEVKKAPVKKVEKKVVAKVEKPVAEKKIVAKTSQTPKKSAELTASKIEAKPVAKKEVKAEPTKEATIEAKSEETKKQVPVAEKVKKTLAYNFKLFDRWDADVIVGDPGLRRYINLKPILVPFSQGRNIKKQFWKSEKHIVERLILKLMVVGHKGKRQFKDNGHNTGEYNTIAGNVIKTFELIEKKTKQNPIEVFVRAIENGAPREGVTTIEYGGVRYPKAVDLSPQRRIDLVLRWMTQGSYHSKAGRGNRKNLPERLSEQIMLTAANDQASNAIKKRHETERSASASR